MRQLLNVSYAIQVEAMDESELKAFERELVKAPDDPRRVSRGQEDLMELFRKGPAALG